MARADVFIKYTVLVQYKNVYLIDDEEPDLAEPHTFRLMGSQGLEFHNAREILEVEVEAEDICHIEEPDDRPDIMPDGGAY